jgi:hypothetical protein
MRQQAMTCLVLIGRVAMMRAIKKCAIRRRESGGERQVHEDMAHVEFHVKCTNIQTMLIPVFLGKKG